jgi:pantoate--beta-alanine ligase
MKRPFVFKSLTEWRSFRNELSKNITTKKIGFVPTMGALHHGHRSLLERARTECEFVVLSIFVNPTQFDNHNDLEKYPTNIEQDVRLAEEAGANFIILPNRDDVYSDDYRYRVSESHFSKELCGAHRPGHFDGVLTVVLKLLNLVQPHRAYFGQKDFQQLELIRGMVESLFLDVEIIPCQTLREIDGLAMSSRNLRLTPEQKNKASLISRYLRESLERDLPPDWVSDRLTDSGFIVDYAKDMTLGRPPDIRRFVAAKLGDVRLIDNMNLREAKQLQGQLLGRGN